jgi:hypothetical protein
MRLDFGFAKTAVCKRLGIISPCLKWIPPNKQKKITVLDKLAEYEAAKRSTQPLYDEWSQTHEQGLVGNLGYTHSDGIDISEEMLNVARPKPIYGKLTSGDLMKTTVIKTGAYQAAVCAGSFAPGHLGPECYPEIIRMVQPGSPIVIFMNGAHFVEDGYQAHIDRLAQSGDWTVIEIKAFNYMSAFERPGRLIVARKC